MLKNGAIFDYQSLRISLRFWLYFFHFYTTVGRLYHMIVLAATFQGKLLMPIRIITTTMKRQVEKFMTII